VSWLQKKQVGFETKKKRGPSKEKGKEGLLPFKKTVVAQENPLPFLGEERGGGGGGAQNRGKKVGRPFHVEKGTPKKRRPRGGQDKE